MLAITPAKVLRARGPSRAPRSRGHGHRRCQLQIDFARLPRQRVPRFVLSPRRILSDVLSKGWVESAIPFIAFIAMVLGVVLGTKRIFDRRPI